ncbi:MAG: type II toxin-antitoxin system HipA family toxin [Micropruina sp.]
MTAKRARELAVLIGGEVAGWLTQDPQLRFRYDAAYLAAPNPTPLSISLPLSDEVYRQGRIAPWIDGLLPDSEDVRDRWARQFGVSARNPFALLTHMGEECPGAVQFCTPERVGEVQGQNGSYLAVSDDDIAARLAQLRQDASSWTVAGERWSLAGAQSKFALAWTDGGWHEAVGNKPTTHIVKPGALGFMGHGLNEHLTMAAASNLGLRAAPTRFQEFNGLCAVIVTRYDRVRDQGETLRIHQEDLCQALGVARGKKYEESGGPGAATVTDLLWEVSGGEDVWRFTESLVFNYLVGGSDAHGKNFALLLSGSQVRLAPLYDLSSALPYEPRGEDSGLHRLAMSIGGQRRFGEVREREWIKLARRSRIDPGRLLDRLRSLAEDLPDALSTAISATATSDLDTPVRYLDRLVAHLRSAAA